MMMKILGRLLDPLSTEKSTGRPRHRCLDKDRVCMVPFGDIELCALKLTEDDESRFSVCASFHLQADRTGCAVTRDRLERNGWVVIVKTRDHGVLPYDVWKEMMADATGGVVGEHVSRRENSECEIKGARSRRPPDTDGEVGRGTCDCKGGTPADEAAPDAHVAGGRRMMMMMRRKRPVKNSARRR
jgi:hypothetical protein